MVFLSLLKVAGLIVLNFKWGTWSKGIIKPPSLQRTCFSPLKILKCMDTKKLTGRNNPRTWLGLSLNVDGSISSLHSTPLKVRRATWASLASPCRMSPNTKRLNRLDVHHLTYYPHLLPQTYLRQLLCSWRESLFFLFYSDILNPGFALASNEAERPLLRTVQWAPTNPSLTTSTQVWLEVL